MGTSEEKMNEDQADEIKEKLDSIAINAITSEQGKEIIKLLQEIATELAEFQTEFSKQ